VTQTIADFHSQASRRFARGLARAFGGAVIFSLPLLMTEEMWNLGLYTDRLRLALLLILTLPLFIGLAHHAGFEDTFNWKEDFRDACVACAVAFFAAAVMLTLFGTMKTGISLDHAIGMLALQLVPGGIGALLGRSLLEKKEAKEPEKGPEGKYLGRLFLMLAGALFLGINIAPTDEVVMITHQMTEWHSLALMLMSLALMHAFVYAVEFRGGAIIPEGSSGWQLFLRFTVVGYALAIIASLYLLWTFSRIEGLDIIETASMTLVLSFPAALGAAAARLIL
jgi:putative integral membrane protein (TIGR02587 family)